MPIPRNKQYLFWSKHTGDLDVNRDRAYIVHQTLAFGTLEDVRWLRTVYPIATIQKTFQYEPIKIYTPRAYHFTKRLLNIPDDAAPAFRYDKTLPRRTGS